MAFAPHSQSNPPQPRRAELTRANVPVPGQFCPEEMARRRETTRRLYDQGELEQLAPLLEETLQWAPSDVPLRILASQVDFYRGRSSRAVEGILEVLRGEPLNVPALGWLATCFLLMNHTEEARLGLTRLARLEPPYDFAEAAITFALFGEDGGVLKCFTEARAQGAAPASLAHFAGVSLARQGLWGEACQCWQTSLGLDSRLLVARANLENAMGPRERPWFLASSDWPFSPALFRRVQENPRDFERLLREDSVFRALLPALLDRGDPLMRRLAGSALR